jgi:hypothetical protein
MIVRYSRALVNVVKETTFATHFFILFLYPMNLEFEFEIVQHQKTRPP